MIHILACLAIVAIILICLKSPRHDTYNINDLCDTKGRIHNPVRKEHRMVLSMARGLVRDLLNHLKKQTKSKNAKEILGWMSPQNVFLFSGEGASGGRMKRHNESHRACLFINPDVSDNRDIHRLQSKICHELAHLTGFGHDRKWRDTWKYLLNITSRDLGWKNSLDCGSCIKYKMCNKNICPRCDWREGDHMTCPPLNQRGKLLN
jgi:hypothetical protein